MILTNKEEIFLLGLSPLNVHIKKMEMTKTETQRPYTQVLGRLRGVGLRPTRQPQARAQQFVEGTDEF